MLTELQEKRLEKIWGSMVRLETAKYYVDIRSRI